MLFIKKAGAKNSRGAPALKPILFQKSLFSFCLLSRLLFKIAMHGFSFTKRASAQNTRARAGSLKVCISSSFSFSVHSLLLFWEGKGWRVGAGETAPAFVECFQCVLSQIISSIASPRASYPATYPRRLLIKKFFISIIYYSKLSSLNGRFLWTFFEK